VVPQHTYDEADRLIDTGVEYEAFGNQTKVPAVDAGEHEITASFYLDNQVATQKQNGETTSYSYDPAGRTEKTVSEGTTKATIVNHYPGPGEAIWTRNIPESTEPCPRPSKTAKRRSCSCTTSRATSSPQRPSAKPKRNSSRPTIPRSSVCLSTVNHQRNTRG
jgi:YD repeat-containing protein